MPSGFGPQSERSPARRTFLGAFDIAAVTALFKNLGGGVEAVPGLTWPVQFVTPGVCTTARSSLQTPKAGCSRLATDSSSDAPG